MNTSLPTHDQDSTSVDTTDVLSHISWYTVPDICEIMDITPGRVHRLIEEQRLLSTRIDGVLKIPADFMKDEKPLSSLHGTAMLLLDSGFSVLEAIQWLFSYEETLGEPPITALRKGHKSPVRRVAQALSM